MAPQKTLTPATWGLLGLLSLIWGGSFLSVRIALDEIGPLWAVAHRVFWAAIVLWGAVALMRLPMPRGWRIWGTFAVMGLLNNILPFGLMAWGQLHITSGLTSIFNAATALFSVLVAALVFADERLTRRRMAGLALGFAGVVCAIGPEALHDFDLRSAGQIAVLAGTVCYALAAAWGRIAMTGLRPEIAAAGMLTASSVMAVPLAWAVEGAPDASLSAATLGAIAYYALVATALAYLLYYRVLAAAGAGNVTLCTLMIPPVAITLGALVRGERLAPLALAGFGLLALGLLVLNGRLRLPLSFRPRPR
ncbi:DMT family transporter [Mesobaculum littorinae]|uniref:DMT family transporter n=1 Tax=Mesobaculum littorinae TaxID=2486419 RepID=A0A438AMI6_9RHOB|nr:DMT family transporter [Mesobaculum littorinae]RVV99879.1 DMT family transporter [Mesobaculum littorinae]